jgi:hypothetical protein
MRSNHLSSVMPALVAEPRSFLHAFSKKDLDGRDEPGRDRGVRFDDLTHSIY